MKGFSLIELLVVVLIIGILSAVALPQYQKAVFKSHFAAWLPLAKAIKEAQDRYFLANGVYSQDFEELDVSFPASCTATSANVISCMDATYALARDAARVAQVMVVPKKMPAGTSNLVFRFPYEETYVQSCYQPYKEPYCLAIGPEGNKNHQYCQAVSSRGGEKKLSTCAANWYYYPLW